MLALGWVERGYYGHRRRPDTVASYDLNWENGMESFRQESLTAFSV